MSKQATGSKLTLDVAANAAVLLLANYSFDLGRCTAAELVECWLSSYPSEWILLAAIEALYQGRYKAKSVEQILTIWMRRKQPLYHFNPEFEQLICNKLPAHLSAALAQPEAALGAYGQNTSNKSNAVAEITIGKTDRTISTASNSPQYGSPFDAVSGASVGTGSDRNQVEPTETIPSQPSEQNLASTSPDAGNQNQPSLLSENGKLTVADSWTNSIGPIEQFEPAAVDPYLYTKLKILADSGEEK